MTDREHTPQIPEQRVRGESEITAELITAATEAEGPLPQDQIDAILGVGPPSPRD